MARQAQDPWFTNFGTGSGAPVRLFAFPFAGGGASIYREWPRLMPDVDVYAAKLPGRESRIRERPLTSIPELLEGLVPAIAPYLDRPYALYGHSLGALVSFELARALVHRGYRPPSRVCVSAFRSPEQPLTRRTLHTLPDEEFLSELKNYGGLPNAVLQSRELIELMLPTLRADFSVFETHHFESAQRLPCPLFALCGSQDRVVPRVQMEAWRNKTSGEFELEELVGGHFFVDQAGRYIAQKMAGTWGLRGEGGNSVVAPSHAGGGAARKTLADAVVP